MTRYDRLRLQFVRLFVRLAGDLHPQKTFGGHDDHTRIYIANTRRCPLFFRKPERPVLIGRQNEPNSPGEKLKRFFEKYFSSS
jgi:hypothetical protein